MRKLAFMLCVLLWPGLAAAGWDEAQAAYQKGDFKAAANEMNKLAAKGDAKAQVNLGTMYADGQGVPRNYKLAVKWYRKAAEQGDVMGQVNLGEMYIQGQGVFRDYVQALKWNILAAQSGDQDAIKYCNTLADNMSSTKIAEAKRLAREWVVKHAKGKPNPVPNPVPNP